jgi:hypothetical protein
MNFLPDKFREYLLEETGGKVFPQGACPDFREYAREVLGPDVELWPMQRLILKVVLNTIGLFPYIPYKPEEMVLLEQMQENAKRPTEETKYQQCVFRNTGKSPNPTVILLVIGRGAGKSFMASLLVSYFIRYLISLGDPHRAFGLARTKPIAIQCLAGKESQAVSLFRSVKTHVSRCGALKHTYEEFKESLNFGNVVEGRAYTSNANTVRGEDTFCYYHEETAFCSEDNPQSEKSFTQTYTAIRPALKNQFNKHGILLFVTSAGMKAGQTYRLYQQIKNGKIDNCVMFQVAIWHINPNFKREDFDQEFREDPITADAEHGSQFVDSLNVFLTQREVWSPIKPYRKEQTHGQKSVQYWIRIDPSRKHDRYALALGHKEYGKDEFGHERIVMVVDYITYWQARWFDKVTGEEVFPKRTADKLKNRCEPVNPQTILNFIEELCKRFNVMGVSSDQFESQYIIDELNDRYGSEEYPFGFINAITEKSNWLAYRNLKKLINTDCIELYHYEPYIEEASVAMRYNKNKPLDTRPDELFGIVEDEWEDDDEESKIDAPNLIYSVQAPTSGAVRTDDVLDGVTYLAWDVMTNPTLGVADISMMGAVSVRENVDKLGKYGAGDGTLSRMPEVW